MNVSCNNGTFCCTNHLNFTLYFAMTNLLQLKTLPLFLLQEKNNCYDVFKFEKTFRLHIDNICGCKTIPRKKLLETSNGGKN